MPFENGSVSFRMLELPRSFPADWVARFAAHRAGALEGIREGEQRGWVTGRHLLDTHIQEHTALYGGWVRLALRLARRQVPAALLRAECRMEELAVMAAGGQSYLKAKVRAEIRQQVLERLLPQMPPQLRAIPFVYLPGTRHLYVAALSDSLLDVFCAALTSALGFGGEAATPESLGASVGSVDLRDVNGVSFSPDLPGAPMAAAPGREFLTWLWFEAESHHGQVRLPDGTELAVLVEGPLTFRHEGDGAHAVVLKKGAPESSYEAKACLLSGKKLSEAKITVARDDQHIWSFGLAADQFLIRGLKLPAGEGALDAISRFQERMEFLQEWRRMFLDLYGAFLKVRTAPRRWEQTVKAIRAWVAQRPAKR